MATEEGEVCTNRGGEIVVGVYGLELTRQGWPLALAFPFLLQKQRLHRQGLASAALVSGFLVGELKAH
ncbi:hypothetical protein GBA52_028498 [Prunus armeniaca]|nr:hypothetical protein GBA52_028498 [Prunus armeniaca]